MHFKIGRKCKKQRHIILRNFVTDTKGLWVDPQKEEWETENMKKYFIKAYFRKMPKL